MVAIDTVADVGGWPHLGDAERNAMREILTRGPRSRAEIARTLGLSRTSLTRVTRRLVEVGLLTGGEMELRGITGRPSELLNARLDAYRFFGVKLTGESLYCTVTDLGARVIASFEEPLRDTEVDTVLDQVSDVFRSMSREHEGIVAAGIALAGDIAFVDGNAVVIDSPFLGWREVPVAQLLRARFGIPIAVENDVRSLTAAEHWFGAGAGCDTFGLITVGTGIGFGFVSSRQVIGGHRGRAGRLDHLTIDSAGPICGLGHRGCASAFLPSPVILEALRMPGVDYRHAVELARGGHAGALRAFGDAGYALGVLLGTVANMLDPEKIVLTGDGLAVFDVARARVDDGILAVRVPPSAATPIHVQPFEFTEWARAGAVAGIRHVLSPARG